MTLELIVARGANGAIGLNGTMPWHIPEDLKHFKNVTMGCPIIMGRKTWESIGRPLPGRTNIVVSRCSDFQAQGALVAPSLEQAIALAAPAERIFIIGGGELYRQALSRVEVAWVTEIHASPEADTFFDALPPESWHKEVLSSLAATPNRPSLDFCRYTRR